MSEAKVFEIVGEEAMLAFGETCGRRIRDTGPVIIELQGELGAGKTTIARGCLRGLGFAGRVKSPTYTLMEPYETEAGPAMHLDLYRLADPEELEFLGLRDISDGSTTLLVEWPGKGVGHLPAADIRIRLAYAGDGRRVELEALTTRGERWLAPLEAEA